MSVKTNIYSGNNSMHKHENSIRLSKKHTPHYSQMCTNKYIGQEAQFINLELKLHWKQFQDWKSYG